ncbi:TRAP transporter small permease [Ammoniphilus sp. YIM 78166]|uniref:TRAP transporter small permease n=1 Tax=Ammoniphilus sp. YIM 78166 TaxID=1644106 RepID=UPI00106F810F|nr:TRAP transporter small permease [Ammoniphilus sp. YIM 78166]
MKTIKKWALRVDSFFENFALLALSSMTLIVIIQVFTRKALNFVFVWSEEVTLLLMVWCSFMGIAVGFREKLHIAMDSFTNLFGHRFNRIWDKVIALCILGFGLFLVINGWSFSIDQYPNRLPATGWTNALYYIVMPITGLMICVYSILSLLGIDTRRHGQELEEELPR